MFDSWSVFVFKYPQLGEFLRYGLKTGGKWKEREKCIGKMVVSRLQVRALSRESKVQKLKVVVGRPKRPKKKVVQSKSFLHVQIEEKNTTHIYF